MSQQTESTILMPPHLRLLSRLKSANGDSVAHRFPGAAGVKLTHRDGNFRAEATDGRMAAIITGPASRLEPPNGTDKFPVLENAAPTGEPVLRVRIDARRLADLLMLAHEATKHYDSENSGVVLEVYRPEAKTAKQSFPPLVVRARNSPDESFYGMLMPMTKYGGGESSVEIKTEAAAPAPPEESPSVAPAAPAPAHVTFREWL